MKIFAVRTLFTPAGTFIMSVQTSELNISKKRPDTALGIYATLITSNQNVKLPTPLVVLRIKFCLFPSTWNSFKLWTLAVVYIKQINMKQTIPYSHSNLHATEITQIGQLTNTVTTAKSDNTAKAMFLSTCTNINLLILFLYHLFTFKRSFHLHWSKNKQIIVDLFLKKIHPCGQLRVCKLFIHHCCFIMRYAFYFSVSQWRLWMSPLLVLLWAMQDHNLAALGICWYRNMAQRTP